jgi:hypothetical protein
MSHSARAARPAVDVSPTEFVLRAVFFGLLALAAVWAALESGTWWGAAIALLGKAFAVAGIVVSVLALLNDEQAESWRSSRSLAAVLGAAAIAAIVLSVTLP